MNTQENNATLDLEFQLEQSVQSWVNRSFNFIQLPVLECWVNKNDGTLIEYIRNYSDEEVFEDWILEMELNVLVQKWSTDTERESVILMEKDSCQEDFVNSYGQEEWEEFKSWCIDSDNYGGDIQDYIMEQENYPVWNTLFEFRDSFRNNEEDIQKCLKVGLGVIEGVDNFNTILFMSSCGHSFYSAYWIPLYLEFFPDEKVKYAGVNYSHL